MHIENNINFGWEGLSPEDYARLLGYYAGLSDPDETGRFVWKTDGQLFVTANGLMYGVCTVFDDAEDEPVFCLKLDNPFANPKDKKNLAKTYFEMEASLLGKKDYASFQKSIEMYISDDISNGIRNGSISEDILQASTQKEAERAIAKMQDC